MPFHTGKQEIASKSVEYFLSKTIILGVDTILAETHEYLHPGEQKYFWAGSTYKIS
jgi:hypothetical protein